MGLLPLLAAGHSHQAPGPYQAAVRKGLQWLVQHQKPDGDLSAGSAGGPRMDCHGLAALALCDAYALTSDKALAGAAQRAVAFIEAAQDPQGGGGRLMVTSLACLCLEVYYRYPPLAQSSGIVANPPAVESSPQARAFRETGPAGG